MGSASTTSPAKTCGHPPPSKNRAAEALVSPETAEERPHVTDQKLGLFHGGEVPAARDLRPAPDVAEEPLRARALLHVVHRPFCRRSAQEGQGSGGGALPVIWRRSLPSCRGTAPCRLGIDLGPVRSCSRAL